MIPDCQSGGPGSIRFPVSGFQFPVRMRTGHWPLDTGHRETPGGRNHLFFFTPQIILRWFSVSCFEFPVIVQIIFSSSSLSWKPEYNFPSTTMDGTMKTP